MRCFVQTDKEKDHSGREATFKLQQQLTCELVMLESDYREMNRSDKTEEKQNEPLPPNIS